MKAAGSARIRRLMVRVEMFFQGFPGYVFGNYPLERVMSTRPRMKRRNMAPMRPLVPFGA